jgi:hypothetical protein
LQDLSRWLLSHLPVIERQVEVEQSEAAAVLISSKLILKCQKKEI